MRKVVYSLILTLLSVSCSSGASQNSFATPKQVETVSQEQATDSQVKENRTFIIQWFKGMNWSFINTFFVILIIIVGIDLNKWTDLFTGMEEEGTFAQLLTFFILPFLITFITTLFTAYLRFINEKKQVKEQDKQRTFFEYYLTYRVPTLLTTAWTALSIFALLNEWPVTTNPRYGEIATPLFLFVCPLGFACLIAAPIATYLISYMKLPDTIKPKKAPQKTDLLSFLIRWSSYSSCMIIYNSIFITVTYLSREIAKSLSDSSHNLLTYIVFPLIITSIVAGLSAWISYRSEKEAIRSEQKTFNKHVLRHWISPLLSFTSTLLFCFAYNNILESAKWGWVERLSPTSNDNFNRSFFYFGYPLLLFVVVLAPIFVLIEIYKFAPNNVQSDLSEKSPKDAQSKA